ncbi:MAG: MFS transporter [Acidimicrobiia bacterium]
MPRRVFASVIATSTAGVLPVFLLGGLAVQIRDDLGLRESAQGWVVFGYFGVSALSSAAFGRLVERIGPVAAMRLSSVLSAGCLAGAAAAPSFTVLLVWLALGGLANSLAQPGSNALIVAAVDARRNGLAFGVKQSAIPAATLLAGLAVPTVALTVGWRWAFAGAAAFAVAAGLLVPQAPGAPAATPVAAPPGAARRGRPEAALSSLLVLGVGAGLGSAMANCLGAFLTSTAVEAGIARGPAGALLSAGSLLGLSSRLFAGWRADSMAGSHFRVVIAMLATGSSGLALLATGTPTGIVAGTALAFGFGWAWPGIFNLAVVSHNRAAPAAATGVTQSGTYAGGAVGPVVFGYLVGHGGYRQAWLAFVVVALAGAAVIELGRRRIERPTGALNPALR